MNRQRLAATILLAVGATSAHAGAFLFSDSNAQRVTHPANVALNSSNPTPSVTVCLDPAAQPTSGNPEQAIRNAVATYNRNTAIQGNVKSAAAAGVPGGQPDFESVFLHELGHCVGLDHSALGPSETGCFGADCNGIYATISTDGNNGSYNLTLGADGMRGSRDDGRGDDVNLHWYQRGVNNPFAMPPAVVDRTTFAVTTNFLPAGHTAVETSTSHSPCGNPSANTAGLPGRVASTQNTMFPVICTNNVIRELAPDDVNTLRIARAGADGTQGTSDDYVPTLSYIGKTTNCDVKVRFSGSGFGVCEVSASGTGNNYVIVDGTITLAQTNAVNWHFNQTNTTVPPSANLSVTLTATPNPVPRGDALTYRITVANVGPQAATSVSAVQALPPGTTYDGFSGSGWSCSRSGNTLTCTRASLAVSASSTIDVTVDVPGNYANASLASQVTVSSALADPVSGNNSANLSVPIDLIVDRIFGDGFE